MPSSLQGDPFRVVLAALALASLTGCGADTVPTVPPQDSDILSDADDVPVDLGTDRPFDTGSDTGSEDVPEDRGFDVLPEQPPADVPQDSGVDLGPDLGVDVPTDTGADVPVDTGADVPRDTGADVPRDTGMDVPRDTGMDVPVDTGVDVPRDTGVDTGVDVCSGTVCAARCVDLQTDRANCGACGRDCAALPGVRADAVRCVAGRCDLTGACISGRAHCTGPVESGCETALSSATSCGACGRVCPSTAPLCALGPAGYACVSGCPTGSIRCGAACVDTTSDSSHCGACFQACPAVTNALTICLSNTCGFRCNTGYHRCGGACASNTSPASCGALCTPCPAVANATATCDGTSCGFACNAGYHRCGGACQSNASVNTCGALCTPCPAVANATTTCDGTSCGFTCNAGYTRSGAGCVPVTTAAPPRLIFPPSTSVVSARRPTLRWALASGTTGARVELCRDRACTRVVSTFDALGSSVTLGGDLPNGVIFWRLRGLAGGAAGTATSPAWEFTARPRSAPLATAFGSVLDVNGDGFADVAVGASGTGLNQGRVWVYHGALTGLSSTAAARPTGPDGANGYFGNSVASAGDVNGDGYCDLIVGAYLAGASSGRAYLYPGGPTGIATVPSATLAGPDAGGYFGYSVASAGDVNADGYGDVIVGAYLATSSVGRAYVFLGSATGLRTTPSTALLGTDTNGSFGYSVAGAGDVNGDGYADVIVGAYGATRLTGRALVYLGSASGTLSTPSVSLSGPDGAGGSFGASVAGAGDVNGDGYADVLVGAYTAMGNVGRAHLFLGRASGTTPTPSVSLTGPDATGYFGSSVAFVGDLQGDGFDDLGVGAPNALTGTGRVHVYLGGASPSVSPTVSLTGVDGAGGQFGFSLAGAGDAQGDGFGDLVVGAQGAVRAAGRMHFYTGGAAILTRSPVLSITGPDGASTNYGISVAALPWSWSWRGS